MAKSRPVPGVQALVVKPTVAAVMLDCSRADIYNRMARGELRRVVLGNSKSVRIPIEDVYALAEGREVAS